VEVKETSTISSAKHVSVFQQRTVKAKVTNLDAEKYPIQQEN